MMILTSTTPERSAAPIGLPKAGLPGKEEALAAARQFETFFVDLLLKELSNDLGPGGFFGEESGAQTQQGLFQTMLAEELTVRGPGLGLAQRLVEEWVRRGLVAEPDASESAPREVGRG